MAARQLETFSTERFAVVPLVDDGHEPGFRPSVQVWMLRAGSRTLWRLACQFPLESMPPPDVIADGLLARSGPVEAGAWLELQGLITDAVEVLRGGISA